MLGATYSLSVAWTISKKAPDETDEQQRSWLTVNERAAFV
jgi:hypothetical protein